MTIAEEILQAVSTLVREHGKKVFSRKDIRDQIGVDQDTWLSSYTAIFQSMRVDHPGGAPPVGKRCKGVFKRLSHGKYTLTEYGEKLIGLENNDNWLPDNTKHSNNQERLQKMSKAKRIGIILLIALLMGFIFEFCIVLKVDWGIIALYGFVATIAAFFLAATLGQSLIAVEASERAQTNPITSLDQAGAYLAVFFNSICRICRCHDRVCSCTFSRCNLGNGIRKVITGCEWDAPLFKAGWRGWGFGIPPNLFGGGETLINKDRNKGAY